MHVYQ